MASWKRDLASGLVVLLPIVVTLYVVWWIFVKLAAIALLSPLVTNPVVGVLLTLSVFLLVVFSVGYMMRTALGGFVEGVIDELFNQLPGLRIVYNASKMAVETALTGTSDLQKPVKVTLWNDMRMTAFKTGQKTQDGRDVLFLPTAPNITTGFVIELEPEKYEETGERVEEALTRVLSAGFGETAETTTVEKVVDD
ncbi:DUF502 domain-containing protein [Halanaeroarchaeum sulfurireducens]|uniref:DUF502 domain-containing protein n=1 Tax=Halanaeroarchaeum sulfurireducens TaxID=1604004 RepID=A0A0F7PAT0_9EURY|nr:DUF502 domain-containing protein [Halanaeroarchaeum sulfurireducens]AKH96734.1 hypothetical protein HLASF_0223 [Halanaeroarchaeum sulfurireducens]ALG81136.1 hypothetical protein HLASA_0223 [Halanaeroarchaeum sulfurireducens]